MRITAGGVLVKEDAILLGLRSLQKEHYPNAWDIFGGHLEKDETPETALIREFQEELGVTPANYALMIATLDEPDVQSYGPGKHHIYQITQWTGRPENRSTEHQEIRWFKQNKLNELKLASREYLRIFGF